MTVEETTKLRAEAIAKLLLLYKSTDLEDAHVQADGILCDLLAQLGYIDVVDAYERIPKWYAS